MGHVVDDDDATAIIDALERRSPEDSRKALEEHIDTVIHKHLFATVRD